MKIKEMREKRIEAFNSAQSIYNNAAAENRDLTPEEDKQFKDYCAEAEKFDKMISRAEQLKVLNEQPDDMIDGLNPDDFAGVILPDDVKSTKQFAADVKSFAAVFRAKVTGDITAANYGTSNNPYLIPTTIADKIERRVAELAPIYELATKYNKRGSYVIPVVDTTTDDVTVAYSEEFATITAHAAATTGITLSDHAFSALTKISNELIDGTDLEIVEQVIEYIAEKIAAFQNHEGIVGTANKSAGIAGSYDKTNMAVTLADKDEITGDDLKKVKMRLPSVYRKKAAYLMNPDTLEKISLLKDGEGRYLFDVDNDKLCGLPVMTDENMPKLGTANKDVVFCGDFSGLAVKKARPNSIKILDQLFAAENAIGIIATGYIDATVSNKQKIAGIRTPAN